MKNLSTLVLLILCLVGGTARAQSVESDRAAAAPADPAREVLVTFADRILARGPHGSPGPYVDRGAEYGTTTWSRRVGDAIAVEHHLRRVVEWPVMSLGVHCIVFAVDDARPVADVLAELARDERVGSVQTMRMFHVLAGDPYAPLQTAIHGMNIEGAHRHATGRGVTIAMVDTGVDFHHPDLAGQITGHEDLSQAGAGREFDNDVHGTAVAGVIVALADNGQGIVGVAPHARLLVLRACWPQNEGELGATCNSLSIATALDAAIRARPQIINLSLTGPADPLVEALLVEAMAKGIVVVVAEPPASEPAPGFIAGLDRVIRVRSAGQSAPGGEDEGHRTIAAPGVDVLTTFPHGTYNYISGSSFAAANVSGIVALLLEVRPGLSSRDIHAALDAGRIHTEGAPGADGVDACVALNSLDGGKVDCGPL